MYQELSRKKLPSVLEGTFVTISIFAILFGINFILSRFLHAHAGYTDLVTILFFIVIAYWVIHKYTITYKYMLISNEFIVQQLIKNKGKVLLNISVEQIKSIGLINSPEYEDAKKNIKNRYRFYNDWKKSKRYYCIYIENNQEHFFEFQPSDKLIVLINNKFSDVVNSEKSLIK